MDSFGNQGKSSFVMANNEKVQDLTAEVKQCIEHSTNKILKLQRYLISNLFVFSM